MGFSMSAVTLLAAVGFAAAFTASPSMALGRGSFAPPLSLKGSNSRPVAAGRVFPSTRHGAAKLTAVAEGVDAAQQLAFVAAHLDANAVAHIDQSVAQAFQLLADAGAAAAEAAGPAKEESPGVFGMLVLGVQSALTGIHSVLKAAGVPGAWGLSIMMFTIAVKAVTYPLNYKQMASTMAMQKVQPKLKAIQARYKEDPQKQNEMIAQLYKDEEVNPLAGCIPTLIQLPIFISLYRGLLELAQADKLQESFLWIPSLEGPVGEYNPVTNLPVDSLGWLTKNWVDGHPALGWEATVAYLSLPVILVATQSISQKLLQPPASDDPAQQQTQQILKFLPLMIGWFALNVPAGLGVYWVINNGLSTLQQWYIRQQFKVDEPEPAMAGGGAPMKFQDEIKASSRVAEPKSGFTPSAKKEPEAGDLMLAEDSEDEEGGSEESKSAAKKKRKAKGKKNSGK